VPLSARIRRGVILVAALTGVATTFSLGQWQLSRAAQKQAMVDHRERQKALPDLDLNAPQAIEIIASDVATHLDRRVRVVGRWESARTVFLDNRQMDGRPGFYVLTPLRTPGGSVLMVQRGWLPRDPRDREALPPVPTPQEPVELRGRIAPPPPRLLELAAAPTPGTSVIRQNLDLAAFSTETGLALAPFTVLMTGDAPDGLLRRWPDVGSGVAKHHGYAFQWFGLSALIAVLYVWFQFIAPRRRPRG